MNKKGSMELSVNSIVILVIAIVIMGLILGFIRSKFSEVGGNLVTNEPDPQTASSDDRITLSRETISAIPGSQAVLKVNIFNPAPSDYNTYPNISCTGLSRPLANTTNSKTIIQNGQASYIVSLTVSKQEPRQKSALCSVSTANDIVVTIPNTAGSGNCPSACSPNTGTNPCSTCGTATGCTGVAPSCPSQDFVKNGCTCTLDMQAIIPPKDFVLQIN